MPVLNDPKREKFAQLVARGIPATEAYERAGYQRNSGNAANMRKRPEINKRIDEIQSGMAESNQQALDDYLRDNGIDYAFMIKHMLDIAMRAKEAGKYGDAAAALKDVSRELFGMFTDKKTVTVEKNVTNTSATLSVQDLTGAFKQLTQAFDGPTLEGVAIRIDEPRALIPSGTEPSGVNQ